MGILYYKDSNGVVHEIGAPPDNPTPEHGDLLGLADDDHPQYHTDARGDARYSQLSHDHAGVYEAAGAVSAHETTHAPADAITEADHASIDHTGLPGVGGGGVTDHGALDGLADDDHTQYALADGSRGNFEVAGAAAAATADKVASSDYDSIVKMTQAAYDALGTPDPATLYVIVG